MACAAGSSHTHELRRWVQVACTITPNSGTSAHGDIIGGALLRLPAQQAQCGKLCPIWLHRAQVLPLRSSDTGAQTALMCISLRLVQLTQECPRVRPEPAASPSPASSQVAPILLPVAVSADG